MRIIDEEKDTRLKEGAGVGVDIEFVNGVRQEVNFDFKGQNLRMEIVEEVPETEVILRSYMWDKKVSGEPLFYIDNKGGNVSNGGTLYEVIMNENLYLDFTDWPSSYKDLKENYDIPGTDRWGSVVTDIPLFMDFLKEHYSKVEGRANCAADGNYMFGSGYVSGPLDDYPADGFIEFMFNVGESRDFVCDIHTTDVWVEPTDYMKDAWNWCWRNWSKVLAPGEEPEEDDEDFIDDIVWDEEYNM